VIYSQSAGVADCILRRCRLSNGFERRREQGRKASSSLGTASVTAVVAEDHPCPGTHDCVAHRRVPCAARRLRSSRGALFAE